jgi:glucose/arabinose dehydrogenase
MRIRRDRIAFLGGLLLSTSAALGQSGGDLPDGFVVETFASGFSQPTALAFASDGTLFVAEREGAIRVVRDGAVQMDPAATLEVFTGGEGGLLGLIVDPDYANNGHLYAFVSVSTVEQRILRLRIEDGVATDVSLVRGNLPTAGGNHNGGAIDIGPDGLLYFAIGDTGTPELSQEITTLAGKVSRIRLDGTTPDDNPFVTLTGTPRAVWATGFRNPFRMCFAPDGRLFVGDVGSSDDRRREEINLLQRGADYGWPHAEGFANAGDSVSESYVDPILAYAEEGASISGCAVYTGEQFPEKFRGNLFHLDYTSHGLFRVVLEGDEVVSHERFLQAANGPVDLTEGPDGALYWVELFSGEVRRLSYPAGVSYGSEEPDDGDDPSEGPSDEPGEDEPSDSNDGPAIRFPLCGTGSLAAVGWMMAVMLVGRVSRKSSALPVVR